MGDDAARGGHQPRRPRARRRRDDRRLARDRARDAEGGRRRRAVHAERHRLDARARRLVDRRRARRRRASLEPTIAQMGFTPDVHLYEEGAKRNSKDVPDAPTHDTASRDLAFIVSTSGVGGTRKDVAHTHGASLRDTCPGRALARRRARRRRVVHDRRRLGADDVEHRRSGRGRAAPRSSFTRASSTSTSVSICSSGSARASSASRRASTRHSQRTRSSSASGHPACDASSPPATSSTPRSSPSSRSAGA